MKNRAKCKLCSSIIESFHQHDYVTCKCGEISIDGGSYHFSASAKDWRNFLRVDDEGNEIVVKVVDKPCADNAGLGPEPCVTIDGPSNKPTKEELLEMLGSMIKTIEELPTNAMTLPITHYDHYSALLLIKAIMETK